MLNGNKTPCQKTSTAQFPNIIGYAPTKQIMAMYGNPRTPLLPQFTNMWANNGNNVMRCLGCNNIISEQPPKSPQKYIETRLSHSNLSGSALTNSLSRKQLCSNVNAVNQLSANMIDIANDGTLNTSSPKSPSILSSSGKYKNTW